MNSNRRSVVKGIGATTTLLLGGTGTAVADEDTDSQGDGTTAEVRIGHLSPDAPDVDVYVDGSKVVSGLAYSEFAPEGLSGAYYDLPAGEYDITTKIAGTDTAIDPLSVSGFPVEANRNYTVLATGEVSPESESEPSLGLLPLVDNGDDETALPPADAALVRLVHVSPDAGEVDLAVVRDGDTLTTIPGVTFGQATGYLELPPGEYTVDVGPGAIEVPVSLEAGTKLSGYVIGNATTEDEDDAALGAVLSLEAKSPATGADASARANAEGPEREGDRDEGGDEEEEREDDKEEERRESDDE